MSRISDAVENVRTLFARLSGREKALVLAASAGLVTVVATFIIFGVNLSLAGLKDRLATKQESHERIVALKERFVSARGDIDRIRKEIRENKNTLTREIGSLAQENGVEISQVSQSKGAVDKKAGVREESLKVDLRKVGLPQLLRFMESIEQRNKLFFIRSIEMKRRFDDKSLIDATFNVSTLVPLEEEQG